MTNRNLKKSIEEQTPLKVELVDSYRLIIDGTPLFIKGGLIRLPGGEVHIFREPSGLIEILRFSKILKVSDEKASHIIGRLQNLTNFKHK